MKTDYKLERYEGNPIISPENFPVPADSVMNCGQAMYKGKTVLLIAAVYRELNEEGNLSGIHVALSEDGIHFDINPKPLCKTLKWTHCEGEFDRWVIDPRLTKIGDDYYIVRPGQGPEGPSALLEKTTDFESCEFVECIALPPNRVPCLFPEKINGMYAKLDRPYQIGSTNPTGSIWISYSPNLIHWGQYRPVLYPGWTPYFEAKIGPTPPIKTDKGWLVIIHGVWNTCADSRYSIGAMLLDINDPTIVLGRTSGYILTPEAPYERTGHVSNVVFPCGAIADYELDRIRVYYGAADERVCLATGSLSRLLRALLNNG